MYHLFTSLITGGFPTALDSSKAPTMTVVVTAKPVSNCKCVSLQIEEQIFFIANIKSCIRLICLIYDILRRHNTLI